MVNTTTCFPAASNSLIRATIGAMIGAIMERTASVLGLARDASKLGLADSVLGPAPGAAEDVEVVVNEVLVLARTAVMISATLISTGTTSLPASNAVNCLVVFGTYEPTTINPPVAVVVVAAAAVVVVAAAADAVVVAAVSVVVVAVAMAVC